MDLALGEWSSGKFVKHSQFDEKNTMKPVYDSHVKLLESMAAPTRSMALQHVYKAAR